jgi:protein-L-isoaspartate(D-aspartate) O-methyltransferase
MAAPATTLKAPDHAAARARMVDMQIARRGITNPHVLVAMREVPRERFVPDDVAEFAYEDSALPIEEAQTISQPYIVALMLEAAGIEPGERVLDVGTGSGYAAAVASRIAARVYTIERHGTLAHIARRRIGLLGYRNIEFRVGDGTAGWLEAAPFDVIIVAAGGPSVPATLKQQLAVGGRLVIPIGDERQQTLMMVTRTSQHEFADEDWGDVAFVPLVGAHGWQEPGKLVELRRAPSIARARDIPELIRHAAEPISALEDTTVASLCERFGGARVVLLGEATHGTSEFYRARAAITRRLIEQHGFNIVAVEADWPDAATIDRYIRHKPARGDTLPFQRFPTWMWRNAEVAEFLDWLRGYNAPRDADDRVGFFGLDLYSLNASARAVIDYLDKVDPQAGAVARERYGCLTPWQHDPATYGRAAISSGYAKCEEAVTAMLRDLAQKALDYAAQDGDDLLDAEQNARLVAAAERYYRVMYHGSAESWNLRDSHMFETLERLLAFHEPASKAVVWAHNSHIGDASATEMGQVRDELNIGQLCRERFGPAAALIGFGTDRGTVAAASDWDGPMEVKTVLPARADSYERLCRDSAVARFLIDLRAGERDELREALLAPRLERAIGVIYRPETELHSHYFQATLPQQFDGWLWFEETRAVSALPARQGEGVPETYPFGL